MASDKDKYTSHSVMVGAILVNYRYCKGKFGGSLTHDHFEFLSNLISETGYRSHFVFSEEVDAAGGHNAYAAAFCAEHLSSNSKVDTNQADLFECCF